jgi:GT2 family glycosyltransferase
MEVSKGITLSFIIPVFNSEKYVKECIDSILDFPSDHIEIILLMTARRMEAELYVMSMEQHIKM